MLFQRVLRVEQNQVGERWVGARSRETKPVLHLDHFQVLLAIITAEDKSQRSRKSYKIHIGLRGNN